MNALLRSALAAAAVGLFALPGAQALTLTDVVANDNVVDTSFSSATQISADVDFVNTQAVTLSFTLDAEDVSAGSVAFNAILREVSGGAFPGVTLGLSAGASFASVGSSVSINNAALVNVQLDAGDRIARIGLSPASNEIYLGDPFFEGATDWQVSFGGLAAGQSFTLSISPVPEPAAWHQAAAGLAVLVSLAALRRRGK